MANGIERKLTTILAADVEGYSRLMEADEVAAMTMLMDSREVFAGLIERHRGRIANTAGDGLIAEFPSVVEAVECAVEVQRELGARNRWRADGRPMQFRIGLHLGDVMVDGGDLFGEGVNLAARLQTMAEPGGVMISQAVYDQVRAKLAIDYEYLGEREAKNLAGRVPVYRVLLDGAPTAGAAPSPGAPDRDDTNRPGVAETVPREEARGRLAKHATQLGIVWIGLLAIDLFTGGTFWSIWPGIAFATILGLEAAPLVAGGRVDATTVRLGVVIAVLAAVNAVTWSGYPWFLWPAGALISGCGLARTGRRRASKP